MQREHTKIAILHHAGGGNLGDDASVDAVITGIKLRWPDAVIAAFTMNPEEIVKRHDIHSYPLKRHRWTIGYNCVMEDVGTSGSRVVDWLRTTKAPLIRRLRSAFRELAFWFASRRVLRSFDLLVLSGGGQLTDRSGPWSFPYTILSWFLLARSAGVRSIVLNVGVGPLIHPLSKLFITGALRVADYVSFRDTESQVLAKNVGFSGKSQVFADNVYSFEVPSCVNEKQRQPIVGIAPMPYPADPPFNAATDKIIYEDVIAKFGIFAAYLVERSHRLMLFGTDYGVDSGPIGDLQTILRDRHHIVTAPYVPATSCEALLSEMAAMDYVVTCRFHGVIFAHLLNKPVLAVSHHSKVADLMSAIGLSQYCLDIRTFDPKELAEKLAELTENRDEIKSLMATSVAIYRSQLINQFDQLFPPRKTKLCCFENGDSTQCYK